MGKVGGVFAVGLIGATGLVVANRLDFGPECITNPGWASCGMDGVPKAYHAVLDAAHHIGELLSSAPDVDVFQDDVYTSNVGGGTVEIRTASADWPLIDKLVRLKPFEIKHNGDIAYSAESLSRVTTSMVGKVVSVKFPDPNDPINGHEQAYVMGVDNQGTKDRTDDKLVPININDLDSFRMESKAVLPAPTFSSSPEGQAEYQECITNLVAGTGDNGGCRLSGIDGHNEAVDATILDNLYDQYLSGDQDVIDSLRIASNVALGNYGPDKWFLDQPETIRTTMVDKVSLEERFADSDNDLEIEDVHAIFLEDDSCRPVEWVPKHKIDLTRVEELSTDHKYHAEDIRVETFGAQQGSWQNDATQAEHIAGLEKIMGKQMLDKTWLAKWEYHHDNYPQVINQMISDANGHFSAPAGALPDTLMTVTPANC